MKLKAYIDTHKGITFLALHGTYGLLWVMKPRLFPDRQWEQKAPLWFGWMAWLGLVFYWLPGWIAFLPLSVFVLFYWIPNMLRKEKSVSRYQDYGKYRQDVRLFIPFLF
jgi:hypothetical protein